MSLYEDLGVNPAASPEDIKRAHRQGVQKHHPDKDGGDREAFEKVQHAYVVLSDPKRRERYDRTGDDGQKRQPSEFQEIAQIVVGAFDRAIKEAGASFKRTNVIDKMVALLKADAARGEEANCGVARGKADMVEMRRRLGFNGEEGKNMLDSMLLGRIAEADRQKEANDATIAKLGKAVEHVKLYGWEVDAPPSRSDPFASYFGMDQDALFRMMRDEIGSRSIFGRGGLGMRPIPLMPLGDEIRTTPHRRPTITMCDVAAEFAPHTPKAPKRRTATRHGITGLYTRPHTYTVDQDGKQVPAARGSWANFERQAAAITKGGLK